MQNKNRTPSLSEVVSQAIDSSSADIRVSFPARVVSFDGKGAVSAQILIKQKLGEEIVSYPVISDVPVHFMRAGGFRFTVPIKAGDEGSLVFFDRCIDSWYSTGKESESIDDRLHDLSDCFFVPGVCSQPNHKSVFADGLSVESEDGSAYIRVTSGKILIKGDIEHDGNSTITGDSTVNGNSVTDGSMEVKGSGSISGIDFESHVHGGVQTGDGKTQGAE